jgi:hypothetical protein
MRFRSVIRIVPAERESEQSRHRRSRFVPSESDKTTIPHLVLDVEADPETNLARATGLWLN